MNGNRFATGQILEKPVEVVKGRILAGWPQKAPEPWGGSPGNRALEDQDVGKTWDPIYLLDQNASLWSLENQMFIVGLNTQPCAFW